MTDDERRALKEEGTPDQPQGDDFERVITEFYATLLAKQQPLGKEFEQVLCDNLRELYVRS